MDTAEVHWRPLGTLLVERGLLSAEELEDALQAQRETGKRLGEILVERGLVSHPALTDTLAGQYGIELTSESGFGTGLRSLIERRHAAGRRNALPASPGEEKTEYDLETFEVEDVLRAPGELIALEPQLEEQWARLAAAEAKVAERDALIEKLEHRLADLGDGAATQTKALNRRLGALRKELEDREQKLTSLENAIDVARAARDRDAEQAQAEAKSLQEEVARLQRERGTEQARGSELRDEIDAVRQAFEERQSELDALQTELDAERARRHASERERAEERTRAEELGNEVRALQAEVARERACAGSLQEELDGLQGDADERLEDLRKRAERAESERDREQT
ncbi:MAG: type pilus assembly protein PilB, partial [Gaiellaceae bacterium]|nr:type pilus assembly protein PilB [Gaiellaceae bacterium]